MTDKVIYAYTPASEGRGYPPFINLTLIGDKVRVIVRDDEQNGFMDRMPGHMSTMWLPMSEIKLLKEALNELSVD
jgi:hypothetical protein